ncbi:MAG: hypothetical protein M1835_006791 [Candelina submexicana]|nr:MAG: hypothetical protein M1835_006791 [Candelina submexicana]
MAHPTANSPANQDGSDSSTPHVALNTVSARRMSAASDQDDPNLAALRTNSWAAEQAKIRLQNSVDLFIRLLPTIDAMLDSLLPKMLSRLGLAAGRSASETQLDVPGKGDISRATDHEKFVGIAAEDQARSVDGSSTNESIRDLEKSTASPISPDLSTQYDKAKGRVSLPIRVSSAGPPENALELHEQRVYYTHGMFGDVSPQWKTEPDPQIIQDIIKPYLHQCGLIDHKPLVQFFAGGALNKLYTITASNGEADKEGQFIFRVALGLDPYYKVESEVGAIEYIRRHTSIPVPRLYAYDSSTNNELGMEWILMERIRGTSAWEYYSTHREFSESGWDDSMWDCKVALVKKLADWTDEMSRLRFNKIGNIYIDWDNSSANDVAFKIGRCMDYDFCKEKRLGFGIERGPFDSAHDYIRTQIRFQTEDIKDPRHYQLIEERLKARLRRKEEPGKPVADDESDDEEEDMIPYEPEQLEQMPKTCDALLRLLPLAFPPRPETPSSMMFRHGDISDNNVLVDSDGKAIALVDWELAGSCSPDMARAYPQILYSDHHHADSIKWEKEEPKDEHYLLNEDNYVKSRLRRVFVARLVELDSPWVEVIKADETWVLEDDMKTLRTRLLGFVNSFPISCSTRSIAEIEEKLRQGHLEEVIHGYRLGADDGHLLLP